MTFCSHITNELASHKVRTYPADFACFFSHNQNMARRGIPKSKVNWFLREWMEACDLKGRGAQAKMMEKTGWSKATMSQLYNGTQDYSPKILNEAAMALNAETWELLMLPERAMRMRRLRAELVELAHEAEAPEPPSLLTKRASQATKPEEKRGTGTHG